MKAPWESQEQYESRMEQREEMAQRLRDMLDASAERTAEILASINSKKDDE